MNALVPPRGTALAMLAVVALLAPFAGWAQEADSQNANANTGALVVNEVADTKKIDIQKEEWQVAIGVASFSVPRYSGDDDNESLVFPNLELRYKDRLRLSLLSGVNYDVLNRGAWSAGPFLDYDFGRDTNPELIGFEDVNPSVEIGGFFEYTFNDVTAQVKVLHGIGGHDSTSLTATIRHAKLYDTGFIPLFFLIGPAFRFGDSEYLNTFYGITEQQSLSSGLPPTSLSSGVISYGLDVVLVVPLSQNIFIRNFLLLESLSRDIANSPIVTNQGDAFQQTLGIELGYIF